MYNSKKVLAVIPARGGSKRLTGKNIRNLLDKPLIAWTIEQSLISKYIDKVIVSTDDPKIAEVAQRFGAEVPFLRPESLSTDAADSISVLRHAMEFFNDEYDYIVLLQPTSPLRLVNDIDGSFDAIDKDVKAVVSVTECEHSPLWTNTLPENDSLENFIRPEIKNKRSQDLPEYYRLNGAVYLAESNYLIKNNGFFGNQSKAYKMSSESSVDIDHLMDFQLVELLMKNKLA